MKIHVSFTKKLTMGKGGEDFDCPVQFFEISESHRTIMLRIKDGSEVDVGHLTVTSNSLVGANISKEDLNSFSPNFENLKLFLVIV